MENNKDKCDYRVLLVQWTGDYREAYYRLEANGAENYYAQRYSVDSAGEMARRYASYGVLCLTGAEKYSSLMPNGVYAMSAGIDGNKCLDLSSAIEMISQYAPTHMVVTTPQLQILNWGLRHGVDVLPQFADTFQFGAINLSPIRRIVSRWRHRVSCWRLARVINDQRIRWVSNHNINACRDLVQIGVVQNKIVPWDWPPVSRAEDHDPKKIETGRDCYRIVFVGAMAPTKGVGDAVRAVAELRKLGRAVRLRVIGRGDDQSFRQMANSLNVADAIDFDGPRSHPEVLAAVKAADIALVPSWHAYPEGLPMTIYEAMSVRTPVVCSDHPAFRDRVGHGLSALCVPERSPVELARAIESILSDPDRYARMSEATGATWAKLVCPVTYYELIQRWISNTPDDNQWLRDFSLSSGRYD